MPNGLICFGSVENASGNAATNSAMFRSILVLLFAINPSLGAPAATYSPPNFSKFTRFQGRHANFFVCYAFKIKCGLQTGQRSNRSQPSSDTPDRGRKCHNL